MSVAHRQGILHDWPRGRRYDRLGALKAMALTPIGDIATATLTEATDETVTWETATDWDNAVDENGVRHETNADADFPASADVIEMGYPTDDETGAASLELYVPGDENSGSTLNDISGNARDGSASGATPGSGGAWGSDAWSYDGSDDFAGFGDLPFSFSAFTVFAWMNLSSRAQYGKIITDGHHNESWSLNSQLGGDGDPSFQIANGNTVKWTAFSHMNTWVSIAGVYDGTTMYIYGNGSEQNSTTSSGPPSTTNPLRFMYDDKSDELTGGLLEEVRIYSTGLSATQVSNLHDAGTSSYLETATKSFSSATKPDLQNLSYNLNGETITLDVIGSPSGTSETVSQTLDGATSYDLTWSNSHTDFRVKINMSLAAFGNTTPDLSRVELTTP